MNPSLLLTMKGSAMKKNELELGHQTTLGMKHRCLTYQLYNLKNFFLNFEIISNLQRSYKNSTGNSLSDPPIFNILPHLLSRFLSLLICCFSPSG